MTKKEHAQAIYLSQCEGTLLTPEVFVRGQAVFFATSDRCDELRDDDVHHCQFLETHVQPLQCKCRNDETRANTRNESRVMNDERGILHNVPGDMIVPRLGFEGSSACATMLKIGHSSEQSWFRNTK